MPPSSRPRQDGTENKERTAKSQEQELKRARGAISCAECRRLKLKCDKTVPCSSCKRRGCASICPNGSLTTGQGTRFILADTDRLHRKIAEMSDRIRQLEDGLAILQSSVTREPHPLLAGDLLKVKSGLELHSASELGASELQRERSGGDGPREDEEEESAYIDAFGTLAVRDDGAATFYGRSAGTESLLLDDKPQLSISTLAGPSGTQSDLPPEINQLASTFPHGPPEVPIYDLQDLISGYLPQWERAAQLRDLYLEQAPWFFGAVTQRQLFEEIFPLFYEQARHELLSKGPRGQFGASAEAFSLQQTGTGLPHASSHELALMFVVFCFGALTDPDLPPAPHNEEASRYYQLTRAALSLEPVMDRPPSVATVQVLSLMGIYMGMVADDRSIECTWSLMGLASKLAQSTGLHRDCARFKLTSAETQKRRALFWELFITDCWQALATGRLPTFELQFVDTELPEDPDETLADDGTHQPSFPAWKARWGKECVSAVVMGTLPAQPPKYSVILELDRRIRDMALPKYAQQPPPHDAGLAQTMSHYMPINYLHLTLLYVHRCYFATALNDHPADPMRSQYAPSFLAGYRSATALLNTIREQFSRFPAQITRFWVIWTHAFSACVMLGSVVTRGGSTKTAQAAMGELRAACDLFEQAAKRGGRATKFVPPLRKLQEKAQAAYFKGLQPLRPDIFTPRSAESEQDELSIFSGRTARTVATKSNRPQRPPPSVPPTTTTSETSSPATSHSGASDPNARSSQSPAAEVFPGLDSSYRTAVHPELVAELRQFEGQINHASAHYQPPPFPPPGQQEQQYVYADQQSYQQQHQEPQQQMWYQNNAHSEHQQHQQHQHHQHQHQNQHQHQHQHQHYSTSPPTSHGSQEQPHPYAYASPPEQPAVQSQEHHPQGYTYQQQEAVGANLHSVPIYGGAYSPPQGADTTQYDNNPYMQVASTAPPSATSSQYSAYATHSVPDHRSELWAVNVGVASPESEMSSTTTTYATPSAYDSGGAEQGHPGHHAQPMYHQYHAGVQPPQPLQPQHTGQAIQPQHTGQMVQPQHTGQMMQPQHTGQAMQVQHTGHMHHTQQVQYAQDPQYGYAQQQQMTLQPPQQPHPPSAPYHVQPGAPYTLTETWTSFIQHELPGPPGGGPVRR